MALIEGQQQLRGLVLGAGTAYQHATNFNPFTRTIRADQGGPRAWNRGSWSGAEWHDEVIIPMRILTRGAGAAGFTALHFPLVAAFAPSSSDLELRFVVGGSEYVMYGRPRLVDPEPRARDGSAYYQAAFVALDPTIYSGTLHTVVLLEPVTSGGLTLPITVDPLTIGATFTAGRTTVTNAGTANSYPVFRVDGPCNQPSITATQGSTVTTLRIALTLTAGQWLDIDAAARTVYMNGTASRRGQASGTWPVFAPGNTDLAFNAATYDAAGQLTTSWRDAWL